MIQRGRKSSQANIVALAPTARRARLTPPATLTTEQASIFNETATQHPHLTQGDAVILAAFAIAADRLLKEAARKKADPKAWEAANRVLLAHARALRLTQVSSTRAETLGRKRADGHQPTAFTFRELSRHRQEDDVDDDQ